MTMGFYVPTNKDVKFPKACEQCHFYDGLLCCVLDTYIYDPENKHGECPLIEVPPHGDLIDRDAARGSIKPWSPEDERNGCTFDTVKKLMYTLLGRAPTIIPAEPAEEGQ